jgi:hypothetical protein
MIDEKFELNRIYLHNSRGISPIYKNLVLSPDGAIIGESSLKEAKIGENSTVIYKSEIVGHLTNCIYNQQSEKLSVAFRLTLNKKSDFMNENQEYLFVLPDTRPQKITCPMCITTFLPGKSPCGCIMDSEILIFDLISIFGITIYDARIDKWDNKPNLFEIKRSFFAGPLSSLIL